MDPREYSFVQNGPDCVCHHRRLDHVGWDDRYEMNFRDLRCQIPLCEDCPPTGYRPLGPLHPDVLLLADESLRQGEDEERRRTMARLRRWSIGGVVAAVTCTFLATVARGTDHMSLAVALVLLAVFPATVAVVAGLKNAHRMGQPRGLLYASSLVVVPLLLVNMASALIDLPLAMFLGTIIVFVAAGVLATAISTRRDEARFSRVVRQVSADLEAMVADASRPPSTS